MIVPLIRLQRFEANCWTNSSPSFPPQRSIHRNWVLYISLSAIDWEHAIVGKPKQIESIVSTTQLMNIIFFFFFIVLLVVVALWDVQDCDDQSNPIVSESGWSSVALSTSEWWVHQQSQECRCHRFAAITFPFEDLQSEEYDPFVHCLNCMLQWIFRPVSVWIPMLDQGWANL